MAFSGDQLTYATQNPLKVVDDRDVVLHVLAVVQVLRVLAFVYNLLQVFCTFRAQILVCARIPRSHQQLGFWLYASDLSHPIEPERLLGANEQGFVAEYLCQIKIFRTLFGPF